MIPLFWFVLLPILGAIIIYLIGYNRLKYIALTFQIVFLIIAFLNFLNIKQFGWVLETLGGYPQGIGITLVCTQLTAVLLLLTIFLFTCMVLFNIHKEYMNKLFFLLFFILQGLLNGIFLSNDLFNLYVLIELATIVVSILIMFKKDHRSIYDGMVYLLINIVAMSFFLFGIGYLYKILGSLDMTTLHQRMTQLDTPATLVLPYCLIITAVGLKSAIMPLFSWLPRAHGTPSAPSIVSAILSGLYVKSGIYLFIRVQDLFEPYIQTDSLFLLLGFLTAFIGFIFALSQTDLKLILAYHTVSQVGLIIYGLSIGHIESYWGSIYHIINHAFFKSVLFLTAGIIIEAYQTRDIREIHGVYKRMPFVSVITLIAMLGITGAPFFNGSISKYFIQKGSSDWSELGLIMINLGTVISFIKYSSIFISRSSDYEPYKITINQKLVISLLAFFCFFGGIFGSQFVDFLFSVDVTVSALGYVQKSILYVISLCIGYLFYKHAYARILLFKKIRDIELSFTGLCFSLVIFFVGLLSYMMLQFRVI